MATIRQLVPLSSDALSGVSINATRAGYLGNTNAVAGTVNASACIVTNSSKGITGMGSITSTGTITANTITDGVASLSGGTLSGATIVSPNLTSPTFASCTINGSITGNAIDTISFSGFNYRVASSELIQDAIAAGDTATLSSAYAYTDSEIASLVAPAVTGDYIIDYRSFSGSVTSTPVSKIELVAPKDGTYNVILRLKKASDSGTFHGRIYVNDVATGTVRSHSSTGVGYYEENIAVSAGDILQLYLDDSNGDTAVDCRMALAEGVPVQSAFPYSTALDWVS